MSTILMNRKEKYKNTDEVLEHITKKIVDIVDLDGICKLHPDKRIEKLHRIIKKLVDEEKIVISEKNISILVKQIYEETFEFGPISNLMNDDSVSEIMVNSWNDIYIEACGCLEKTEITFKNEQHLRNMVERIISPLGLRIDESSPMVDARLKDGSRINAVTNPVSTDDLVLTIRKFKKNMLSVEDLIAAGTISKGIADFINKCVRCKLNIIISGASSTGKTTFLNILSNYIPLDERVITIEETLELNLNIKNLVRLESRPPNIEGAGGVTLRDLVRNALRMRPDRIIVGEMRGLEAVDVLQAMNTGHEGSMTSIHANNPVDMLSRIETMLLMSGINLTPSSARSMIASSIDLIIHLERIERGRRILSRISELTSSISKYDNRPVLEVRDIFLSNNIKEGPVFTGEIPLFIKKFESRGEHFDFKGI